MATPPKRSRPGGRIKKVAVEGNIGESAPLAYAGRGMGKAGLARAGGRDGSRGARCFRPCLGETQLCGLFDICLPLPLLFPSLLSPSCFSPFPLYEGSSHYGKAGQQGCFNNIFLAVSVRKRLLIRSGGTNKPINNVRDFTLTP